MNLKFLSIIILTISYVTNMPAQNHIKSEINPPFLNFIIPSSGFIPVDSSLYDLLCDDISDSLWKRQPADSIDIMIFTEGPSGSGRYWKVIVGIADSGKQSPSRGVCFTTTTIGWRTLQSFNNLPLKWIDDKDKDGQPEIIIWDSFPLHREATNAEYGMIAWVYEFSKNNEFTINWLLTKEIAKEIASAYRKPNGSSLYKFLELRKRIADKLEKFISQ